MFICQEAVDKTPADCEGGGHESKCLASSLNAALDRRQFPPQTQDYHDTDE